MICLLCNTHPRPSGSLLCPECEQRMQQYPAGLLMIYVGGLAERYREWMQEWREMEKGEMRG
jgi:hypothetical protein